MVILDAVCPSCGISTKIEEGQDWRCCGCKEPYVFTPDIERSSPEEIADWEARHP